MSTADGKGNTLREPETLFIFTVSFEKSARDKLEPELS